MNKVFLGLGSNIGNRYAHLQRCIDMILANENIALGEVSSVYETDPVGFSFQDKFLNMVVEISYNSPPFYLLNEIKSIEHIMGRSTPFRWGPRNIDVDILYFDNSIIKTNDLCIPHPEINNRMFVLQPMAEIAPDFRCPVSTCTMVELCRACTDESNICKYNCSKQDFFFQDMNSV